MSKNADNISNWIKDYASKAGLETLVVGVSGGIDSAVVSTLCARTGMPTIAMVMPIRQKVEQHNLAVDHALWLSEQYSNVHFHTVDLTIAFEEFERLFEFSGTDLAFANTRSRLRMTALYQMAQSHKGIVVGTGNKVEDFGVGFYTKYGDGGVDISPIADMMKTEVWEMGKQLGVDQRIIEAEPTDGLWDDGRVDQDQLHGLTYQELEKAMVLAESTAPLDAHEQRLVDTYNKIRKPNEHKMNPIPVYTGD